MQVRNEDGLNRVSSKGNRVTRFGIRFKGRVVRMSRECLTSDHFFFSFPVLDSNDIYPLLSFETPCSPHSSNIM